MKKLFTLIAAALFAVGASADEVTLWENVTDGQVLNIADIESAGGADADIVTFYLEDNTGTDHNGWGMGGFGPSSGWGTDFAFTGNGTSWREETTVGEIKTLAGSDPGVRVRLYNGAELKKVTLQPSITYGDAQTITATDGFIPASEFAGLSDAAIIEFTYNVAGDVTGYVGWGIGRIGSNDDAGEGPSVEIASLPVKALGDAVYKCKMIDIKPALAATPDGIKVAFWDFGDGKCTASLVKVEAFDVVSGEGGEEAGGKSWDFTSLAADVIAALEANAKWESSSQGSGESAFTRYTYTEEIAKDTYVDLGEIGFTAGAGIEVGRAGSKMGTGTIRVDANNRIQLNCSNGVFKIKNLKAGDIVKIQIASANNTEARTFTITNGDKASVDTSNDGTKTEETIKVSADGDLVLQQSKAINIYTITVSGTTGIQETVAPVKVIESGAIYNLAGQKVNETYKGIVIKNGKKYIQK